MVAKNHFCGWSTVSPSHINKNPAEVFPMVQICLCHESLWCGRKNLASCNSQLNMARNRYFSGTAAAVRDVQTERATPPDHPLAVQSKTRWVPGADRNPSPEYIEK